jgi:rubrerythrin
VVSRLGGRPPRLPGARGLLRRTMTRAAGLLGTEMMLRAMRSNEEVLNRQYRIRSERELPREVHDLIERNYADEQRHLAWVEEALKSRLWQQQPAPGPAA